MIMIRSSSTASLSMTRIWVAVTNIEEAIAPDNSILYFGAASVARNNSTLVYRDSIAPNTLPLDYHRFAEQCMLTVYQLDLHKRR